MYTLYVDDVCIMFNKHNSSYWYFIFFTQTQDDFVFSYDVQHTNQPIIDQ